MEASEDIGPLASHCVVTYKNSFYIFGGTIGCNTWASTNFFHYATPPFSQGKISWQPLSTTNVKSVTDPGCIVDETRGLLFVLGGKNQQINSTSPGLQVYDFKTQIWNDPKYSQNFIPRDLINDNWGPRAVWLQPGLMFMWGANSTTQGSYLLDINVTPWQWTILSDSKCNIVPTKSAGVVAIKGNAFIFGVWNNKLSIIMMDTFGAVMEVVNFDLKTFQFENVISAPFSQNITTKRNRGYGAQFSWSDSVFIYGGTAGYCSQPILDTWVVYNMSSQTWERTFNDTKHKNIVSDDLTLPKVDDHDIDNEDTAVPQSTKDDQSIQRK
ncbi:19216_t:CDS:2 [Gigaspora margarita]|uniref:19216_t:CDS:1 n=1 Tax=Gigaspora margarita TaxID=4874 RepID=A0ABN7VBB7_GIGMA|nr:19216_t:CDS:2 [Gigaspora margarita]